MGRKRTTRRGHGQGTVYQKHGKWSISWREDGERKYAHGYDTEEKARAALASIVNRVTQNLPGVPVKEDPKLVPTLGELAPPWLERRKGTHRTADDDENRWTRYLAPVFGKLRPDQVDGGRLRDFIEHMIAPTPKGRGLAANTCGNTVRLLSTFYTDLVERKLAKVNPVAALPRSTRRLYRPKHDPKDTPFLQTLDDVRRVYLALPERVGVAFAVGALAGLRTGEVIALEWGDVDLAARRIHVQRQARHGKVGPTKNGKSRIVPLQAALLPILNEWKLKTGGVGLLVKPVGRGGRKGRPPRFVQIRTLHDGLADAMPKETKPPRARAATDGAAKKKKKRAPKKSALTWYQATRHTFASQWVLGGGSIEQLRDIMGHESVKTTERYAHLRRDHFADADMNRIAVDLSRPAGAVVAFPGANGYRMATETGSATGTEAKEAKQ